MPLTIQQEFESLPAELQREVEDFIAFLRVRYQQRLSEAAESAQHANEAAGLEQIRQARLAGLGSLKGRIWMSPDFTDPLPDLADYQ